MVPSQMRQLPMMPRTLIDTYTIASCVEQPGCSFFSLAAMFDGHCFKKKP